MGPGRKSGGRQRRANMILEPPHKPHRRKTSTGCALSQHRRRIAAVDLFCGAGGLTCGRKQSAIQVLAGVDLDPSCRYLYETNNGVAFHQTDIGELTAD